MFSKVGDAREEVADLAHQLLGHWGDPGIEVLHYLPQADVTVVWLRPLGEPIAAALEATSGWRDEGGNPGE